MSRYQGGWGSGAPRGGGGWGGGGGRGGGGGGQRSGPPSGKSNADWRETVRTDRSASERPIWQLTCYGHEREKPNDVSGDISPEEVRWANMLAMQRGASMQQLVSEFKAAGRARVDQFQALQRAHQPPTMGGPPLPPLTASISNLDWVAGCAVAQPSGGGFGEAASSPFGAPAQPSTAATPFGAPPAAAAAASPFGQPAAAASSPFGAPQQPQAAFTLPFGQPAAAAPSAPFGAAAPQVGQPAAGFGGGFGGGAAPSAAAAGFGGGFGASTGTRTVFGKQESASAAGGSTPFGAAAASPWGGASGGGGSTPFGAPATAAAPAAGGFGGGFGSMQSFQHQQQAAHASPFGAPQQPGQPAFASPFGQPPQQQQQQQQQPQQPVGGGFGGAPNGVQAAAAIENDPDAEAWRAPAFERKQIPERAPPKGVCV